MVVNKLEEEVSSKPNENAKIMKFQKFVSGFLVRTPKSPNLQSSSLCLNFLILKFVKSSITIQRSVLPHD